MTALARPSQPNYFALTAGNTYGVETNGNVSIDVRHIGNLLEERGMRWKVYAQGWPGRCFTGAAHGKYVRKHNLFISYKDVQNGTLPEFSFYVPDQNNNRHDTSIEFASRWLEAQFGPLLRDPKFMREMLFIVTFDEGSSSNHR